MAPEKPTVDPRFATRVRELLGTRGQSLSELAIQSGIDASVLSRLTAESDATRRPPTLGHILALARALGMTPSELTANTAALDELLEWVPREELDREAEARERAQREASAARAELAAERSRFESLSRNLNVCDRARQRAEAELREAETERDAATARGAELQRQLNFAYQAGQNLAAENLQLQSNIARIRAELGQVKAAGAIVGLVGLFAALDKK